MKVKIGDRWYDSNEVPICVRFEEGEKRLISNMQESDSRFAVFPDDIEWSVGHKKRWMTSGR